MKTILIALLLATNYSHAATTHALTNEELKAVNWIMDCPKELSEMSAHWYRIQSAKFQKSKKVQTMTFNFAAPAGFGLWMPIATVSVSRVTMENPPADHPGYNIKCNLKEK